MRLSAHYKPVQALQYENKTTLIKHCKMYFQNLKGETHTNKMLNVIPNVDIAQIHLSTAVLKDIL